MAGHTPWRKAFAHRLGPERIAKIEAQVEKDMAEMVLSELRRQVEMTQTEVAEAMGIHQPAVSDLEKCDDMQISTLRRLVAALGGELSLIVKLPQGSYTLTQFTAKQ